MGLEVKHLTSFKKINETEFVDFDVNQKLNTISHAYRRAPQFDAGYALIKKIIGYPERNVAEFLFNSIKEVCQYLEISTKFIHPNLRPYKQFSNEFVPGLSILDVIMFNPQDAIKDMLEDYSIIEKGTPPANKKGRP